MAQIILEQATRTVNSIFCVGRNYVAHAAELGNALPSAPLIFLKPNNALRTVADGKIVLPAFSQDVHYEAELVLLIGQDADELSKENALNIVAGYGVGLDLTARDEQDVAKAQGLPWAKAKGFKGAAWVSDFVAAEKLPAPQSAEYFCWINDELRQHGKTELMMFSLSRILVDLAAIYGLKQGDLVFTGTPAGVGRLHAGDAIRLQLADCVRAEFQVA